MSDINTVKTVNIPSKNIREYPSRSIAKKNVIKNVIVSNDSFLKKVVRDGAFTFAEANISTSNTNSAWDNVYNGTFDFSGSYSNTADKKQILTSSQTSNSSSLRIDCSISYFVNASNILNKRATQDIGTFLIDNNTTNDISYEFTHSGGGFKTSVTVVLTFDYSNGVLSSQAYVIAKNNQNAFTAKEWFCGVTATVDKMSSSVVSNSHTSGDRMMFFSETNCSLSSGVEIYTIDLSDWSNLLGGECSYTVTPKEGDVVNKEGVTVHIPNTTFDSFTAFKQYCINNFNFLSAYPLIVGVQTKTKKAYANHLRFDSSFDVYTATAVLWKDADESTFDDFSLKLVSNYGVSYSTEDADTLSESQETQNLYTVSANSLFQDETSIGGVQAKASVSTYIKNKFQNGRNTATVNIFYDKYLDSSGNTVYNGEDGSFIKTDDIVTPFTIRTALGSQSFTDVPLFVDGYSTDANGQQVAEGKQFYVTSCEFEYNGGFNINLNLLEKVDTDSVVEEYTVYMPALPTGVDSVVVSRIASEQGFPNQVIVSGGTNATVGFACKGDTLSIAATALDCYETPTIRITNSKGEQTNIVDGDMYVTIVAGTIKRYTVSFDLNGGVGSIPNSFVVDCGTRIDVSGYGTPSRADDDNYTYTFSHWDIDGGTGGSDFEVHSDVVIRARYLAKRKPAWHTLNLINNSWDINVSPTGPTYTSVEGAIYKTNSNIRNVPTRFYTGKDGYMIMTGNANLGNTVRYPINESGVVLGGSSNKYAVSSKNPYGYTFGYSLEATKGRITFTVHAQTFTDDNEEYWDDTTQKFYLTYGHITLNKIEQWYADTSENIIV